MAKNTQNSEGVTGLNRQNKRNGVALLVVTITVILLAISLAVALPVASKEVVREKEESLRFILGEFRRAVDKFKRCNRRLPENLEELIVDANGNRFLRRRYLDPFTGKFDWQSQTASETLIIYSSSDEPSLAGVPYSDFR